MLTRKCDICGAEMRMTTPRYKVTFDGWLYKSEKDICVPCFERIKAEIQTADTPQTEESCERCVYVRGSQWCQGCNGTPKRWDGEKIVDTPQTESTGSPIGDYRDGVGAWQTERMTEEEIDTMLAKVLVGQTDCSWREPND